MFRRMIKELLTLGVCLVFMTNSSLGDAPRPAPQDVKIFSPNHHFCALSSLKESKTQVFASSNRHKPILRCLLKMLSLVILGLWQLW